MAWVAVTKQGREFISMCKPIRVTDEDNYYGWKDTFTEISLYSGSIKKLIGRELSWEDEPVELQNLTRRNNMETKEIKIKVPEGYEIDEENSTLECIKFKPIKKELTYEDVVEELFSNSYYYINGRCKIVTGPMEAKGDKNNATNKKQLERLLALNQLLNIAEYYNRKSPKEGNKVYCINFNERNKTTEYFVGEYTRPMIARGLIPMFNRHADVSAVIYNPNFKAILDLVYKGDED